MLWLSTMSDTVMFYRRGAAASRWIAALLLRDVAAVPRRSP
jgi:hypothetical protein